MKKDITHQFLYNKFKFLRIKNIDVIIACLMLGSLALFWNEYLQEFFSYFMIGLLHKIDYFIYYGLPRSRVLNEYFVYLPLAYILGYNHEKIREKIKKWFH